MIGLSTNVLAFTGTYGGMAPQNTFTVSNMNSIAFDFTNAVVYGPEESGWLSMATASGSVVGAGSRVVTGSVNIASLNAGIYTATNAVKSSNALNSPQNLAVALTINKADQAIAFPPIPEQTTTAQVTLAATADSGLPVGFAIAEGPGTINGTILTFTVSGTVHVAASQAGNINWNAAANFTNSVTVYGISTLAAPPEPGGFGRNLYRQSRRYLERDSWSGRLPGLALCGKQLGGGSQPGQRRPAELQR